MNFIQPGVFGQCTDSGVLAFMRDVKTQCSFPKQVIDKNFCEVTMGVKNRLNLKLLKDGADQAKTVPITIVSRKKFSYN